MTSLKTRMFAGISVVALIAGAGLWLLKDRAPAQPPQFPSPMAAAHRPSAFRGTTQADPSTQSQCSALADSIESKASTNLGTAAGWPKKRLAALTQKIQANARVQITQGNQQENWNCDDLKAATNYISDSARLGELAANEEQLERSGKSVAEMAPRQMDWMDEIRQKSHDPGTPHLIKEN